MLSDARLQMRVFATAKLLSEKLAYVGWDGYHAAHGRIAIL